MSSVEIKALTNTSNPKQQQIQVAPRPQKNVWNQTMATLYLLEQGTILLKEQFRFLIHVPDKDKIEVPIRDVERILLFGNINLSTPAIATCLESRITVLFLSLSGRYKGHLWSKEASNLNVELLQFQHRMITNFN